MRVFIDAQEQWQLLTALNPLFKQALPRIEHLSEDERKDLRVLNAVTTIRHNILSIPLQIQHVQLHQDLEEADFDKFCLALHSLLSIFERLVADDVHHFAKDKRIHGENIAPQHQWLSSSYPRLRALRCFLRNSCSDVTDAQAGGNLADSWLASAEYSTDILLELARFISFHGSRTALEYQYLSKEIQHFHLEVQEVFKESLSAADGNLNNTILLRDDEIHFIRRAHHMNVSSTSLFSFLSESIVCSRPHGARVHLSGFLDPSLSLDLFVAGCENTSWVCTKCKWASRPTTFDIFKHENFTSARFETRVSKMLNLAFDGCGIWHDKVQEAMIDPIDVPESLPTLEELVIPKPSALASTTDMGEFEPEDEKIVELLLASSLFHLNASHWLRGGLDIDRILILGTPHNHDLLKRWRPYIACSLKEATEIEDAEDEDILSFGLLVMEMEAKRRLKPMDKDIDWITGLPSKDSMLKRALVDWKRRLEDNYQQIGKSCLNFRELAEKFYHPALPDRMKRTAAIYRYILAPLHQLITQRYCSTSLLFKGFPQPAKNSQLQSASLSQSGWGSPLIWFDDSKSDSSWHDPIKISYATEFVRNIRPFVDMIRSLPDTCAAPPPWETWRSKKIRIAIIDTGIDRENDILIETALESGSIKDCRDFTGNEEDCQDSHGHGTHIARLMLNMAPEAELYIAKVSDDKTLDVSALSRIAEAIKWAHKTMEVDIISLSFGLEPDNRNVEIDKAIFNAISDNTIIFAAAANNGGNKPRAYPANRRTGVICIHASDGRGNDGGISPSPEARKSNFSTLGISIESRWKGKKVLKSGTSFATPIAAALAANMLEFARYKCSLDEYEQRRLHSYDSIEEILYMMAKERQGYHYIMPLHLWSSKSETDIARKIIGIARS